MKKAIIFILGCLISICSFAQDFEMKLIGGFENDRKQISMRKQEEVAPQDDETGNRLLFNENGELFIYNWDKLTTFKLSDKNSFIKVDSEFDFSDLPCLHGLHRVSNEYLYYTWTITSYMAINQKTGDKKFQVSLNDIFLNDFIYYDENTDILFFHDKNNNLHSIIHPSMNDAENRKNYRNPEKTLQLFNSDYDMKKLGLYKGKYLTVDGQVYYWAGTTINHINYQIYDNKEVDIWNDDELEIKCTSPNEQIESIAIHPSGDIYVLRMNWASNKHNLYYIENTWDVEWRTQWYKEHPSAVRP